MEKAKRVIGIITAVLAITVGLASCADTGRKEEPKNGAYEKTGTGTATGLPANAEVLDIDWPSPDKINQTARSYLSEKNLRLVDSSSVPVLLPNDPEMLKNGIMMIASKTSYDFGVSNVKGLHLSIGASRLVYDFPTTRNIDWEKFETDEIRGTKGSINETEIGWYATWGENGASYDLTMGCTYSNTDPQCEKPGEMVRKAVDNLVYVGGLGKE